MASLREIRLRVDSVKNTKKITYAMKLVAAAKLKRAQEAAQRGRLYTDQLNQMAAALISELGSDGITSPYLATEEGTESSSSRRKKALLLVFGGGRGLCGGYNTNLNRQLEVWVKETERTCDVELVLVGRKPAEYCRRVGRPYLEAFEQVPEDAAKWPIEEVAALIERKFLAGEVNEVFFLFTKFKSAISMTPTISRVLPMDASALVVAQPTAAGSSTSNGVTLFEPSAQEVFSALLPRLLRSKLRQGAFDAKASETGARMTAMDAATKNAGELIDKLTRLRNKLRQNGITSQLLDIVGGAEAVNN
jgi:F-type H+-transporting ATPase subunit gamma